MHARPFERPHDMPGAAVPEFHVIRHVDEMLALGPEWDDLWQRSPGASYYLSSGYALHSWREAAEPNGGQLFCITARSKGRLTLVWPLKIYRRAFWRIIKPLASNAAEDTDILAEDASAVSACIGEALDLVRLHAGADIVDLPLIPVETEFGRQASFALGAGRPASNPFLAWEPGESWEDYRAGLGRNTRKVVDKKHRRLKGMGTLRFELVRGDERIVETTRTLLRFKRAWASGRAETGAYVHSPHFERFLTAISRDARDERQGMLLFALTLDGNALAVQSAAVGHRVDWLAAAYHPDHHQLSPGIVLNEYCLRWAHERGLAVMMGPGREANKEFWCKRQAYASASYRIPGSAWGAAALHLKRTRDALATRKRRAPRCRSGDAGTPAASAP